jgi:AcrR family transcriptional regulator
VARTVPRIRAGSIAEHKLQTRTALLDAAFRSFVSNGFAGTSLTDVASLAGVGRTTLYEYFPNKEELFLALVEERVPPLLDAAVAELPAGDPLERIEAAYRAAFEVLGHNVQLALVLFHVGRELPAHVRDRMWRALDPINLELAEQCKQGLAAGLLQADDPALLHQTIADLLVGAVDQVLAIGYSENAAESILRARLLFLRGGVRAQRL